MKHRYTIILFLLFLYIPFSSTVYSKLYTKNSNHIGGKLISQIGTNYSGYKMAKKNFKNLNAAVIFGCPPLLVATIPITLIDIFGSFLLDTIFLPIDMLCEDKKQWKQPRTGSFQIR